MSDKMKAIVGIICVTVLSGCDSPAVPVPDEAFKACLDKGMTPLYHSGMDVTFKCVKTECDE